MNGEQGAITRRTLGHLMRAIAAFLKSRVGGRARLLLAALLLLMLCINGMNVTNSYIGRYFMSAIESRDAAGFVRYAWLYVAVFAGSTLVGVLFRFTEERLGLLWREWLTRRITGVYIERHLFLQFTGKDAVKCDLIHTQGIGIAHYGAVRLNEYYVSQYIDHRPLAHPSKGAAIASWQNQSMDGRRVPLDGHTGPRQHQPLSLHLPQLLGHVPQPRPARLRGNRRRMETVRHAIRV